MTTPTPPFPPTPPPGHSVQMPYITCREQLDFVMAYLDGELTPEQRLQFERHLSVCPSCVNYLTSYQATVELGKAAMNNPDGPAPEPLPEELIRAIREARSKGT